MRVLDVVFDNHPIFDSNTISFETEDKKILDTIILAGINGSGKTTLLSSIFKTFKKLEDNKFCLDEKDTVNLHLDINEDELEKAPKMIYLPSEVRFQSIHNSNQTDEVPLAYCIDDKSTHDIISYIKQAFDKQIFSNPETTVGKSIDAVCDEINSIFSILDMDVYLVGIKDPKTKMPLFRNESGVEFDINGLSSGEKQLFIRLLSLKSLEPEGCVILIDEPEISLHPSWQQRIVEVYQNIGKDNQIIIATHSPHIISSVKRESLKILSKKERWVKVIDGENLDETYGVTADMILLDIMGLSTTRHPHIQEKIDELKSMVRNELYETEEFKILYEDITGVIGTIDQDILLVNIEIARRKGLKNAGH